jgi:hypothetical protein
MTNSNHWAAVSTPPTPSTFWWIVTPDGSVSRLYSSERGARSQLKRYPCGSRITNSIDSTRINCSPYPPIS